MPTLFKSYPLNERGRDFAVGDIHGYFSALQALLDKVNFNPEVDRLFSVGDLVDRGPESHLAEKWLMRLHAIQGNHEDMAARWPEGRMDPKTYRHNGGGWNMDRTPEQQRVTAAAFASLPIALEVVTRAGLIGLVHADVPGDDWSVFREALLKPDEVSKLKLASMTAVAQWSRDRVDFLDRSVVKNVAYVVVGHTPVRQFTSLGNTLYTDTGGWLPDGAQEPGHFTLLDLNTMRVAATYSRKSLLNWS